MPRVILLDPADDLASLRARLDQEPGTAVGLVVPPGHPVFRRPVAFRLLAVGRPPGSPPVAIISTDPVVRRWAQAVGLPAYPSVAVYERAARGRDWRARLRARLEPLRRLLLVGTTGLLLLLGALWFLVLGPQVVVTLQPAAIPVQETLEITADPQQTAPDPAARRLPARLVPLVVEVWEPLPASGGQRALKQPATGTVVFTNLTDQPLTVARHWVVSTAEGVRFATVEEAVLPGQRGAQARVPVVALEAGERGNVAAGQIVRLERRLRSAEESDRLTKAALVNESVRKLLEAEAKLPTQVAVTNPEPTRGGGERVVVAVTDQDRAAAEARALQRARREAEERLRQEQRAGELALSGTVEFALLTVEAPAQIEMGRKAEAALRLEARARAAFVRLDHLETVAREGWRPTLPAAFALRPETMQIGLPTPVQRSEPPFVFRLPVSAWAVALIDEDRVQAYVRWRDPAAAQRDLMAAFVLARPPEIFVSPAWLGRAFRVRIVYDLPDLSRVAQRSG